MQGPALLFTALLLLSACHRGPDEAQIRKAADDMAVALEKRNSAQFLSHVSPDYRDREGRDFRALKGMMIAGFIRYPNINIVVSGTEVIVRGDEASVRLNAYLTSSEAVLSDREFGGYRVDSDWRREAGTWMLSRAIWEPLASVR